MKTMIMAAVSSALVLAGCNPVKDTKAAEAAVTTFHSRWDAGDLEVIYDTSGPEFKAAGNKADALDFLKGVREKLGKVKTTRQTGWQANTFNMKTRIVLTHETVYENGKGTETFTYGVDGGNATLVGWHLRSNDVMGK